MPPSYLSFGLIVGTGEEGELDSYQFPGILQSDYKNTLSFVRQVKRLWKEDKER